MRHPLLHASRLAAVLVILLGCTGCPAPGGTHLSGQLGWFYGDGVSFSVPLVRLAPRPGEEDRYWELRQGLDSTLVVALSPLTGRGDTFRENAVVTTTSLPSPMTDEQFREQQLAALRAEGSVTNLRTGEDEAGTWAQYDRTVEGKQVRMLSWFFARENRGYVLLGSFSAAEAEVYEPTFREIAATFRFGPPPTGFALLGEAVQAVATAANPR